MELDEVQRKSVEFSIVREGPADLRGARKRSMEFNGAMWSSAELGKVHRTSAEPGRA